MEKRTPTEVEVAEKLLDFRSRQSGFLDTSFDTISGIYALRFMIAFCLNANFVLQCIKTFSKFYILVRFSIVQ